MVRNVHPESQGCVIAAIYEDHAYLYQKGSKIQDLVRNRVPREIQPLPKWRLKSETPEKAELTTVPWPGVGQMEARAYHAEDLEEVRFQFSAHSSQS